MLKLKIIHASTREGRKGIAVSDWVASQLVNHPEFETEFIDLKAVNLPFMDEPNHPKLQQYIHQHTKDWSAKISEADAFIFVTCEYNYGMPAPLKNAFDYLFHEWALKPVGFVGYGGISGGLRAVQQLKLVVSAPNMLAVEGMQIPFFSNQVNDEGKFIPNQSNERSLASMLAELAFLGEKMKPLRDRN